MITSGLCNIERKRCEKANPSLKKKHRIAELPTLTDRVHIVRLFFYSQLGVSPGRPFSIQISGTLSSNELQYENSFTPLFRSNGIFFLMWKYDIQIQYIVFKFCML